MRHVLRAFKREDSRIPLPYSKGENFESCAVCDAPCVESCEQNIIIKVSNGIYLDFSQSGCTFCESCAKTCEQSGKNILDISRGTKIFADIFLDIKSCLAWKKTLCSYCLDSCDSKSIAFSANLYPEITDSCTRCGMCVSVCPSASIRFAKINTGVLV